MIMSMTVALPRWRHRCGGCLGRGIARVAGFGKDQESASGNHIKILMFRKVLTPPSGPSAGTLHRVLFKSHLPGTEGFRGRKRNADGRMWTHTHTHARTRTRARGRAAVPSDETSSPNRENAREVLGAEAIVERARSFFRADEPAPSASRDLWRSTCAGEAGASTGAQSVFFAFARDLFLLARPLARSGSCRPEKKTTRRRLEDINIPVWMPRTIWQPPRGLCAGFEISSTAFAPDSSASLTTPALLLETRRVVRGAVNRALGMAPPNAADFAVVLRRAVQRRLEERGLLGVGVHAKRGLVAVAHVGLGAAAQQAHDLLHVWPIFHNTLPEARVTLDALARWITQVPPTATES